VGTPRLARADLVGCDGGPLRVDVRSGARPGEARPAVVICHGFKGFKDWGFFPRAAERLTLAGFTAVTFNFSGSGVGADGETFSELERWGRQTVSGDLADLATVVDFVAGSGAPWIGLLGHSRGGGTAVVHAAGDRRVRALVTWAAVSRFQRWPPEELERWRREGRLEVVNLRTGQVLPIGRELLDDLESHGGTTLDIVAAASRLAIPWLIVHGADDETVPVDDAGRLERASSSPRTEARRIPGAGHTFGVRHPWAGSTAAFDQVLDATVGFLASALA
jgi:uncharacterized protein